MLIDWFTVAAQVVNFLILVWLLKRFLYKPILHAIDEREQRIAKELEDASAKRAEVQREHKEFQHKHEEFDRRCAELLNQAAAEADAEHQRLLEAARAEADSLRSKLQADVKNEQDRIHREIVHRAQQEVFAIARKALQDLAATSVEERMTEVFLRRLRDLNGEEKHRLVTAPNGSPHPAMVRSAFDLPPDQKASIQGAVRETLGSTTGVQFETDLELISGVELTANGYKVAWSIKEYLASLENRVADLNIKSATTPASRPGEAEHAG